VGERSATARAEAIEEFAAVLAELRSSVGTPSFRAMAGRSRAISHTTLHEAVQGNRLPSWPTTVEFVKACGGDPADYRDRWERANAVVSPGGSDAGPARSAGHAPAPSAASLPGAPAVSALGASAAEDATSAADEAPPGRRGRNAVLGVTASLLLALVAVAWFVGRRGDPLPAASPPSHVAADCPVQQQNPPAAPPLHEGDDIRFIADLTLPDCQHVRRGQTLPKVWRFKNTGAVRWVGYTLHRVDQPQSRDQCQTIPEVPVAATDPGQLVDVRVDVTMPGSPAFCFVRFKVMDQDGKVAFPGRRPVNFQVVVD
jgi:hypothetical protein